MILEVVQTLCHSKVWQLTDSIRAVFLEQITACSSQRPGPSDRLLLPCPLSLPDPSPPCSELLEEGSKKAELKQETKLGPQLPAFVQCQTHGRSRFPARAQASVLLSSCRDGVGWETLGSPTPGKEI